MSEHDHDECDLERVDRVQPEIDGGGDLISPNPEDAVLVTLPTYKLELTARQDFDVHTAITMGLGSYLMQLDGEIAGRSTKLVSVVSDWADAADGDRGMPSAAVHAEEVGKYETNSGMAPGKPIEVGPIDDPTKIPALTTSAMYALDELMIDTWCDDKVIRAGVRRMLEDGLNPVQWMAGFRLILPRYHGAIATFLLLSAQLTDNQDSTRAGLRMITLRLRARCPAYKVHLLPRARPNVTGTVRL